MTPEGFAPGRVIIPLWGITDPKGLPTAENLKRQAGVRYLRSG